MNESNKDQFNKDEFHLFKIPILEYHYKVIKNDSVKLCRRTITDRLYFIFR